MASSKSEIEIKIAIQTPAAARKLIVAAGFELHVPRVFESNVLYDFADLRLRRSGKVLRLRVAGPVATLTFKGKSIDTRHKVREEVETTFQHPGAMRRVFSELDLRPVFRYEKYRTEYRRPAERGIITLDETPIGNFLEIEGRPRWIDRTARQLGFSHQDYITSSYGVLYTAYCSRLAVEPSDMIFRRKR